MQNAARRKFSFQTRDIRIDRWNPCTCFSQLCDSLEEHTNKPQITTNCTNLFLPTYQFHISTHTRRKLHKNHTDVAKLCIHKGTKWTIVSMCSAERPRVLNMCLVMVIISTSGDHSSLNEIVPSSMEKPENLKHGTKASRHGHQTSQETKH